MSLGPWDHRSGEWKWSRVLNTLPGHICWGWGWGWGWWWSIHVVHLLEIHTESLSIFVHLMVEMVTPKYTEMHKSFIALVIRGQSVAARRNHWWKRYPGVPNFEAPQPKSTGSKMETSSSKKHIVRCFQRLLLCNIRQIIEQHLFQCCLTPAWHTDKASNHDWNMFK